ncbi:Hypothetical protein SRAE_1000170000 [Strongyloides ratti]|uniref:Ground-like domain-containing protein n=1 Tax=Strongyloides ratti TaxID=34506 RepID=A0A090MW52_STRRB|nr:Hypothetical protein SRAE_1000170000 [Strongyloides ratti]CEF63438.1 Hypothetical protein SRAE_1000170000 [Strongyloides ratti]
MTRIEVLIILLFITKSYSWFLCPPSNGCGPAPVTSPCCNQQIPTLPQPCCNQRPPLTNNCNGCSSSNNYPQAQVYQPRPYIQPQQLYQIPQSFNQQPQYPIQSNQLPSQFIPQQQYNVVPANGGYPQKDSYITPNPCYQIGRHRCCNQKLQFEMENFLTDYQNTGAKSNFNITFETIVSLGDFETKSYYDGHQICKFERRGKIYMAYETPFENPEDMNSALEKDLGYPVDRPRSSNINSPASNLVHDRGNFEFGTSETSNKGGFQVTDIGVSSHSQRK